MEPLNQVIHGDTLQVLKTLANESVDCVVTSPPYYGLRDYGVEGQIGLEPTLEEYLDKMITITGELKRVLKKTGTMWWNHGDSYNAARSGGHPAGATLALRGGVVLDPFVGSGTTALVARTLRRNFIGIELNPAYIRIAEKRLAQKILI